MDTLTHSLTHTHSEMPIGRFRSLASRNDGHQLLLAKATVTRPCFTIMIRIKWTKTYLHEAEH